jgi:hypothetical protein
MRVPVGAGAGGRKRSKEATVPLLDLFFIIVATFLGGSWLVLTVLVAGDCLGRADLSSPCRVVWIGAAVFLPLVGALTYVVARGRSTPVDVQRRDEYLVAAYISGVASAPSSTEELSRLARLRARGALTAQEYDAQRARILAS